MDKQQTKVLQANGFSFGSIPNLNPQPRAKFYSRDKGSGVVVEHNLPADPYSLNHYLRKGFVLNPSDLKPLAEDVKSNPPVVEVTKVTTKRHYQTHKKTNKEETK